MIRRLPCGVRARCGHARHPAPGSRLGVSRLDARVPGTGRGPDRPDRCARRSRAWACAIVRLAQTRPASAEDPRLATLFAKAAAGDPAAQNAWGEVRERRGRRTGSGRGGALVPPCRRAGLRRGAAQSRGAVRERRRASGIWARPRRYTGKRRRAARCGAAHARALVARAAASRSTMAKRCAGSARWPIGLCHRPSISPSCISTGWASSGRRHGGGAPDEGRRRGHPVAQNNLGLLYAAGRGVPEDPKLAAEWHARAASQGLANAQYQLGLLYERGEGVPRDDAAAARCIRRRRDRGRSRRRPISA